MFWRKKPPLGVPLQQLEAMLAPTTIKASLKDDNTLLAKHEHYTVKVEAVRAERRESQNGPIRAVVRLTSEMPAQFASMFNGKEDGVTSTFNSFAALSALYVDSGKLMNGSRLTIYEEEDSWLSLHLPLLLIATICGNEPVLGAIRRSFGLGGEAAQSGDSEWDEQDMQQVESYLSRVCVCTTGGAGLTAEFPLSQDAISAATGSRDTALFQLMADQPHPELGGGLFCLLQMPHQVKGSSAQLQSICSRLNKLEMAAADLPPHFGAWCPGKLGSNPAYVCFLPNSLHRVSGIAVNTAFWAVNRARWANGVLASMGVTS